MPDAVPAKPLTYDVERDGDRAVVKCHGRLVAGVTDGFHQEIRDLISESTSVVLDLADLTYVDSMGLGTLTRLYVHARSVGCEFRLLHLGKQVVNLLRLTNLLGVLATAEDHGISVG
jgi:anti-sigma B factor antagonist